MADLTLNISQYSPLQQFTVRPWETFSPDDQLAITDKINLIVQTLNRLGKLSNDVVTDWNKVMTWVSNDGMTAEVDSQLQKWKDDGTLVALINAYTGIGDLSTLQTVAKDTLVNAINENVTHLADIVQLSVFAKDFNVIGDGVTDDSTAISNAIQKALTQTPKDNSHLVVEVKLPAGKFAIKNQIVADGTQISPNSGDQITLKISGATQGATILILQNNVGIFNLNNIKVHFEGIRFSGYGYTGSALTFGSATQKQFVSQSEFKNLSFFGFTNIVTSNLLYDSSFIDCGFFAMQGTNSIAFNIINHPIDNTNNLNFYRCHFEQSQSGTFFKALGVNASAQVHHDINFYGCHFETLSFATTILDIRYVNNLNFHGGQFTINNAANSGYTLSNYVPSFRIQDSNLVSFKGTMTQIAPNAGDNTSATSKMIELGGTTTGVSIENSYFNNPSLPSNPSLNALIQQTSGNALVDTSYQSFTLKNLFINDIHLAPFNHNRVYLTDRDLKNRNVMIQHSSVSNELEFSFSVDPQAQDSSFTKFFGVGKQTGVVNANTYTGQFCQTITNGSTVTTNIDASVNANKRGMYMIYADAPGQNFALVYSDGSSLYSLNAGTNFVVGNTNLATSGKFNVFLSGVNIGINNLYGSDRRVSVIPFGFR